MRLLGRPDSTRQRVGNATLDVVDRLTADERSAFAHRYTEVTLPPGAKVCRQGRTGNELLFVLDGTATVWRNDVHVADVTAGAVLGERSMLCLRVYQDADVVATSVMTIAAVSRRDFLDAVAEQPSLRTTLLQLAADRS